MCSPVPLFLPSHEDIEPNTIGTNGARAAKSSDVAATPTDLLEEDVEDELFDTSMVEVTVKLSVGSDEKETAPVQVGADFVRLCLTAQRWAMKMKTLQISCRPRQLV